MRRLPVATFFLFFWSFHSFADQVVMSNGDRLSGLIIKSDAKALVIKTEFAGEVTVQWGAISEINSTDPLHVTVRDGMRTNEMHLWFLSEHLVEMPLVKAED